MADKFKSIFRNEIKLYLVIRKEELVSESFRHCKHTLVLFDDYLYNITLKEKSIDEPIIDGWIKEISNDVSINTVGSHIHFIRQFLLFLIDTGYYCFVPKTIHSKDTYVPYLYTDLDIENIFIVADTFTAPHAVKYIYILKTRCHYYCGYCFAVDCV